MKGDRAGDTTTIKGVKKGTSVPSASPTGFLEAFVFENEAHDLFGVEMRRASPSTSAASSTTLAQKEPMTIISPAQKARAREGREGRPPPRPRRRRRAKAAADDTARRSYAEMHPEQGREGPRGHARRRRRSSAARSRRLPEPTRSPASTPRRPQSSRRAHGGQGGPRGGQEGTGRQRSETCRKTRKKVSSMGKATVIPFGPQHPVLPEPLHLDLVVEDETVIEAIPADRLHPPRAREARRDARLQPVHLRGRAHLRHLRVRALHGLRRDGREAHGRRDPRACRVPARHLARAARASIPMCCGWAWPPTRSASRACSCTAGACASACSTSSRRPRAAASSSRS